MELEKLKQIAEAALLAADEPLSVDQLVKLFRPGEVDSDSIRADLREVLRMLTEESQGRGYELVQVASGYRYQVRQELSTWISRLWEEKPPRYSRALLETLALVAYKQPVTRGDIEQVRGVSVSQSIMRTLLERGWIRVVGQREVPGRPSMYGTSREFLDYFNLKSLDQLPPLAEIRELIEPVIVEEFETEQLEEPARAGDGADVELKAASSEEAASSDEAASSGEDASYEEQVVDLDGDDFDAEIAAAIKAADTASARFNNPDQETGRQVEAAGEDDHDAVPARSQVVDVVTGLSSAADSEFGAQEDGVASQAGHAEAAGAGQKSEQEAEQEQPTAEVVQLPRAPH